MKRLTGMWTALVVMAAVAISAGPVRAWDVVKSGVGQGWSNFTLYTVDSKGQNKAVDARPMVALVEDQRTGAQYIRLTINGQSAVAARQGMEGVRFCKEHVGFYCFPKEVPGVGDDNRQKIVRAKAEADSKSVSERLAAAVSGFFAPIPKTAVKKTAP